MAITKDQKSRFLDNLEIHGVVTRAARESDIRRVSELYTLRRDDDEFRLAWDDSLQVGRDACEDQARQRAFWGLKKPIYQGGQCVGYVDEYSDTLAKMMLEADKPDRYKRGDHLHITGDLRARLDAMSDEELNKHVANLVQKLGVKIE